MVKWVNQVEIPEEDRQLKILEKEKNKKYN
jgi:hypothetical protein